MNFFRTGTGTESQNQKDFRGLEALRHYHTNNFQQFHSTARHFVDERGRFKEISEGFLHRTLDVSPEVDWNKDKCYWDKKTYKPIADLQRAQALKNQNKEKEQKLIEERDLLNLMARIEAFVEAFPVLPGKVEQEDKDCMKNFLKRHDNPENLFAIRNRNYVFMAELWETEKQEEIDNLEKASDAYFEEAQLAFRDLIGGRQEEVRKKIHSNFPRNAAVFDDLGLSDKHPALLEKYAEVERLKQEVRTYNINLKLSENEDIPSKLIPPEPKAVPEKCTKESFCLRFFYGIGRFFQSIFNCIWKLFCCKKTA